jgi:hypothetical protein
MVVTGGDRLWCLEVAAQSDQTAAGRASRDGERNRRLHTGRTRVRHRPRGQR